VHVVIANLMFVERVGRALAALGCRAEPAGSVEAIAAAPGPVVLDLDHERLDAIQFLTRLREDSRARVVPVLAYGSHVHADTLDAARRLGATAVPRSAFSSRLHELLAGLVAS